MIRGIVNGDMYNNHELNCSEKGHLGYYVKILDAIENLFDHMVSKHGKVFFFMFGLSYPKSSYSNYTDNNILLSEFMEDLIRYYKFEMLYDPCYLWARERSDSGQVHYHCVLLLNGNKIRNGHTILRKVTELWGRCLGIENGSGLVHSSFNKKEKRDPFYCNKNNGILLIRCSLQFNQLYEQCYKAASYLAKCFSKGSAPRFVNEFGCSRIPRQYFER